LLYVQKLYHDNNVYFEFHESVFYSKDFNTKTVLFSCQSNDGLYVLSKFSSISIPQAHLSPCVSTSADIWHRRLSHPISNVFNFLVSNNKLDCNSRHSLFQSQAYLLGKSLCLSLGPTSHKSSALIELIFSDVPGPVSIFSSDDFFLFCYVCQCAYTIFLVLFSYCEIWCILYFPSLSSFY
jgi:hypothetical protein